MAVSASLYVIKSKEGIEIGMEKGATEKQREVVLNMLKSGLRLDAAKAS